MKMFQQIVLLALLTPVLLKANSNSDYQEPNPFQFKAERVNLNEVVLQWVTNNEEANEGFQVQRIVAGEHEWTVVAWIKGRGGSDKNVEYKIADENPVQTTAYYRLRQLNVDGTYTYSTVQMVEENTGPTAAVSFFPIPTTDYLNIRLNDVVTKEIDYKIVSKEGRLLQQGTFEVNGESIITMKNTQELPVGLYHIQLVMDDGSQVIQKFFKAK